MLTVKGVFEISNDGVASFTTDMGVMLLRMIGIPAGANEPIIVEMGNNGTFHWNLSNNVMIYGKTQGSDGLFNVSKMEIFTNNIKFVVGEEVRIGNTFFVIQSVAAFGKGHKHSVNIVKDKTYHSCSTN